MQIVMASLLATCPGFELLDGEMLEQLASVSSLIELASQVVLCQQGTVPEALHYLLDGQMALTQTAAGGTQTLIDVVHPISSVALASVVADQRHLMTARAVRPSRLLEIPAAPLRRMIATRPRLAVTMLRDLSQDMHAATRQVLDLKLRNAAQRLGCYLLSLVTLPSPEPVGLRLPYQKRLLAARLGCRYENLSRAFAMLRNCGVETHGSRVILHDMASLRAFAVPDDQAEQEPAATAAEAFSDAFRF